MSKTFAGTGIEPAAFHRFVEEQIYTLPGATRHREEFSILLTGSRAFGCFTPASDVDIDVVCPRETYQAVHRACYDAGLISAPNSFFLHLEGDDWQRYFGHQVGRPHFSLAPLDTVERQFREYQDVPLWIWTNARVIIDPDEQMGKVIRGFAGYPKEVLIKKVKYRSLLADYAGVDIYPHHHKDDRELLPAANAVTTMVSELLRLFFLVEGRPFPYPEKLMHFAESTRLGKEFCPFLQRAVDLAVGAICPELPAWQRLDRAIEMLLCEDVSEEARKFQDSCRAEMIAAGVDADWVNANYGNIDELLNGELGPAP